MRRRRSRRWRFSRAASAASKSSSKLDPTRPVTSGGDGSVQLRKVVVDDSVLARLRRESPAGPSSGGVTAVELRERRGRRARSCVMNCLARLDADEEEVELPSGLCGSWLGAFGELSGDEKLKRRRRPQGEGCDDGGECGVSSVGDVAWVGRGSHPAPSRTPTTGRPPEASCGAGKPPTLGSRSTMRLSRSRSRDSSVLRTSRDARPNVSSARRKTPAASLSRPSPRVDNSLDRLACSDRRSECSSRSSEETDVESR